MPDSNIRVRFAPSPTGFLHVGGLRTALYNFLFARRNGGTFILRIEDTDPTRYVEGAVDNLLETLNWAGLSYDEGPVLGGDCGPYVQSERLDIYRKHAEILLASGHAYRCFCTSERLEQMRLEQQKAKAPPKYDRLCLSLSADEVRARAGEKHVLRLRVPDAETVGFTDIVRGHVQYATDTIDDQVLLKSDGYPTYHLANVVDDHLMRISHVIRGEEWLTSTPKHLLLYRYFGWQPPQFAHLPLLLNPDRSKLSKRQGDVAVEDYRSKGYLPEALVNFVALLGWNPGGEQEVFSLDELTSLFTLERVNDAGAVFDLAKLNWMNAQHIRRKAIDELVEAVTPLIQREGFPLPDAEFVRRTVELMRERTTVLDDFVVGCRYFWTDPTSYDEDAVKKRWKDGARELIQALADRFSPSEEWQATGIEETVRKLAEEQEVSAAKIIHPLRLVASGVAGGPGLFEMLELLGKTSVLRRMRKALETLP